jgi:hypothetical protein
MWLFTFQMCTGTAQYGFNSTSYNVLQYRFVPVFLQILGAGDPFPYLTTSLSDCPWQCSRLIRLHSPHYLYLMRSLPHCCQQPQLLHGPAAVLVVQVQPTSSATLIAATSALLIVGFDLRFYCITSLYLNWIATVAAI